MTRWMCNFCGILIAATMVVGCSGASNTPTTSPAASTDPVLAGAVADALATIDEIDHLYARGPGDAVGVLMTDTAEKGRTSLAREPARVTAMEPFMVYDLSLQAIEADVTLRDGASLVHDHDWLVFTVRKELAALVP